MGLKKFVKKVAHLTYDSANPVHTLLQNTKVAQNVDARLESAGKVQALGWEDGLKAIAKNPSRLLTGIDPASTTIWNKILGTHNAPLVNLYGSPTEDTFEHAEDKGINVRGARDFFKIGDSIAGFYGGSAATSGLDKAYSAVQAARVGNAAPLGNVSSVAPNAVSTLPTSMGGVAPSVTSAAPAAAPGFQMPTTASGWLGLGSDALGLYSAYKQNQLSSKIAKNADPFAKYRAQYGDQLAKLMADPTAFEDDPAYQFILNQGLDATTRKMASQGFSESSNLDKGLISYAEGEASTYRDSELNRLAGLAGAQIAPSPLSSAVGAQSASFDELSSILASIGYGQTRESPAQRQSALYGLYGSDFTGGGNYA